jgi:hypothetical protein
LIRARSCSGFSATTICAVEQLGFAMMFFFGIALDRLGVHLGHDQRHLGVVAVELELSITTQPAFAARGA